VKVEMTMPVPADSGVTVSLPDDVQGLGPGLMVQGEQADVVPFLRAMCAAAEAIASAKEQGS
jgi:hypothetical protein